MSVGVPIHLDSIPVSLDPGELERRPPFSRWMKTPAEGKMRSKIEQLATPVTDVVDPEGVYRIEPVEASTVHAYDPPAELVSGTALVVGVLALNERPQSEQQLESKFAELVWDALENTVLQKAREKMLEHVRSTTADEGLNTTKVFAPGARADGWPLDRRQFMFESLPSASIGVSETGEPVSQKTFTFAMGAGPEIEQADLLISCGECDIVETCVYAGSATTG